MGFIRTCFCLYSLITTILKQKGEAAGTCYPDLVKTYDPLLYYDFENLKSEYIFDDIQGVPARLDGDLSVVTSPLFIGNSFLFDGVNSDVYIAPTPEFNFFTTRSFSIAFWAEPTFPANETAYDRPVVSNAQNTLGVSFVCTASSSWILKIGSGGVAEYLMEGGICQSGLISFVVGSYDSTAKVGSLYVNGQLLSSLPAPSYSAADGALYVGAGLTASGSLSYFEGSIDGVTVFPQPLTDDQVASLYQAGLCNTPTPAPTRAPTPFPTGSPTSQPTSSSAPTAAPTLTPQPTCSPTPYPVTPSPTGSPSPYPLTPLPSASPTPQSLTPSPTSAPTPFSITPSPTSTPYPITPQTTSAPTPSPFTPSPSSSPTPSTTPKPTRAVPPGPKELIPINFVLREDAYKVGQEIHLSGLTEDSEGEAILVRRRIDEFGIPSSTVTLQFDMFVGYKPQGEYCTGGGLTWNYGADSGCLLRRFDDESMCNGVVIGFLPLTPKEGIHIARNGIIQEQDQGTQTFLNKWVTVNIVLGFNGTHHLLDVIVDGKIYFRDSVVFTSADFRDYDETGKMSFYGAADKISLTDEEIAALGLDPASCAAGERIIKDIYVMTSKDSLEEEQLTFTYMPDLNLESDMVYDTNINSDKSMVKQQIDDAVAFHQENDQFIETSHPLVNNIPVEGERGEIPVSTEAGNVESAPAEQVQANYAHFDDAFERDYQSVADDSNPFTSASTEDQENTHSVDESSITSSTSGIPAAEVHNSRENNAEDSTGNITSVNEENMQEENTYTYLTNDDQHPSLESPITPEQLWTESDNDSDLVLANSTDEPQNIKFDDSFFVPTGTPITTQQEIPSIDWEFRTNNNTVVYDSEHVVSNIAHAKEGITRWIENNLTSEIQILESPKSESEYLRSGPATTSVEVGSLKTGSKFLNGFFRGANNMMKSAERFPLKNFHLDTIAPWFILVLGVALGATAYQAAKSAQEELSLHAYDPL